MNIALWILQIILAIALAASGGMKLARSKADLITSDSMALLKEFSQGQIRAIGAAEVAGALGLILPWATGIAPILTPIAAVGVVLLMVGAVVAHRRFGDPAKASAPAAVLAIAAVIVAIGRFAG